MAYRNFAPVYSPTIHAWDKNFDSRPINAVQAFVINAAKLIKIS
jgi:hypothetical protein